MARAPARQTPAAPTDATLAAELGHYGAMVDLQDHLPINMGLKSAMETTMVSLLGSPQLPLTTLGDNTRASPLVKKLVQTARVSSHLVVTGIAPAIASLRIAVQAAIDAEKADGHDLDSVLGSAGMLNVRLRKPTSGAPSTKISNHAWGTAIDFLIVGHNPPANTHDKIPLFIAVLLPFMNKEGWFSGIAFQDTMHFEVADGTIHDWAAQGKLQP